MAFLVLEVLSGLEIDGVSQIFTLFKNVADGGRTPAVHIFESLVLFTPSVLGVRIRQHQQKRQPKFYTLPRAKASRFPEKSSEKRLKMPWVKVQVHRICQSPFWHLFVTPLKMGAKKPESRFRNRLISEGRYTDAVDEVLIKVANAKTKKFKILTERRA